MITYTSKYSGVIEEIARQGESLLSIDGTWVSSNDTKVQAIIDSFDEVAHARGIAKRRITRQANAVMQQAEDTYPEFEKKLWAQQREEIAAWELDNSAPTPLLDKIAQTRGITRVLMLSKASAKIAAYTDAAAVHSGNHQKLRNSIKASSDLEFIHSVNFTE